MFVERKTHRERWSAQLSIKASLYLRPILPRCRTALSQQYSQTTPRSSGNLSRSYNVPYIYAQVV